MLGELVINDYPQLWNATSIHEYVHYWTYNLKK
jgi:hypothetical protein